MDPVEGFAEDGMVHFPRSDGWTDYKRTPNQAIFLAAGDNTLTLRTIGSSGANIDGIHLETMVSMDTATFPVFKFNLDPADDKSGLRGWSCCVQVGEVTLFDGSGTMLSGATATNPVGLEPLRPGGFCDNFGTAQVIARRSSGGHRPRSLMLIRCTDHPPRRAEPRPEPVRRAAVGCRRRQHRPLGHHHPEQRPQVAGLHHG